MVWADTAAEAAQERAVTALMWDDVDQAEIDTDDEERIGPASWTFALQDVPQPGPWIRGAACRTAPSSLFFIRRGESAGPAQQICAKCGVAAQCRTYAIEAGSQLKGIWAGTTERERSRLRRERRDAEGQAAAAGEEPVSIRRRRPPAPRGHMYELLEALTAHPGRWARVGSYPSPHSGSAVASLLRNGHKAAPAGRWVFEGRTVDDGGSEIYALYEGPVEVRDAG